MSARIPELLWPLYFVILLIFIKYPPVQFIKLYSFFKLVYLFLAALGLRCCAWTSSSCGEWGLLFLVVRGLLIVVASLVAEHGL